MTSILTYLVAFVFYALIGWYFWQNKVSTAGAANTSWVYYAMLIPLGLHVMTLYQSVFVGPGLNFGVGSAVSSIFLLTTFIYWFYGLFSRLNDVRMLISAVSLVAAVTVMMPLVFPSLHPLQNTELPAFKAHILVAMMAYSLLTIAAFHAVLMTMVEQQLHHPATSSIFNMFPPLLDMERMLFRIIWAGFILLTLTLLSGVIFSEEVFGQPLTFSHKTLFGFISWGVFAALLIGRRLYGWRGRVAIRWTLTGFVILLLAYIGSKFVLEIVLNR